MASKGNSHPTRPMVCDANLKSSDDHQFTGGHISPVHVNTYFIKNSPSPRQEQQQQQQLYPYSQFQNATAHFDLEADACLSLNVSRSYNDAHHHSVPSSASSDSSLSPQIVFTPPHDPLPELPRIGTQTTTYAAIHRYGGYDAPSGTYNLSPDWYPSTLEPQPYDMPPNADTAACFPQPRSSLVKDKSRTQRTSQANPSSGPELQSHIASTSQSMLFSQPSYQLFAQQQQQQLYQQQFPSTQLQHAPQSRPQLYPLQIPEGAQVGIPFPSATSPSRTIQPRHQSHQLHQSRRFASLRSSSTLTGTVSPSAIMLSHGPKLQQASIKLHHPRPSRRIPIISLDKLASANADFMPTPILHTTNEFPSVSIRQSAYRGLGPIAKKRVDEARNRHAVTQLTSWSVPNENYDLINREPLQREGIVLCSCGCMESYTIPD